MAVAPISRLGLTVALQVPAARIWQAKSSNSGQACTKSVRYRSVCSDPSAVPSRYSRAARWLTTAAAAGDEDPFVEGYISDYPVTDDEVSDDVIASLAAAQKPTAAPQSPAYIDPVTDSLGVGPADVIAAEEATAAFVPTTGAVIEDTVTGGVAYNPEEDVAAERRSVKRILIDSLYGTDRGLRASGETRAELAELVVQLEALNPTPATTYSPLLSGDWVLAYTSFSELLPLLALGSLPLVRVASIVQSVQADSGTVSNTITFEGPVAAVSVAVGAVFEARSDKRVQITFKTATISSPQPLEDGSGTSLPSSLSLFGQTIDLSPFTAAAKPLQDAALSIAKAVSGQPPLKFPLPSLSLPGFDNSGSSSSEEGSGGQQSWLLTTYLDEDLRISRGDGGGLFVLVREGSSLAE